MKDGKKTQMAGNASLKKGLKKSEPSSSDASTNLKMSPSVDEKLRSGTAETPETIGPRTA